MWGASESGGFAGETTGGEEGPAWSPGKQLGQGSLGLAAHRAGRAGRGTSLGQPLRE